MWHLEGLLFDHDMAACQQLGYLQNHTFTFVNTCAWNIIEFDVQQTKTISETSIARKQTFNAEN